MQNKTRKFTGKCRQALSSLAYSCMIFAACLVSPLAAADDEQQQRVFMYVTDGSRDLDLMLREEVGVMRTLLEDAGFAVDIATSQGQKLVGSTTTLEPTVSLDKVNMADYAGVILPCMAPAEGEATWPESVRAILVDAVASDKPVAASRGSVVQLADAGALGNRRFTAFSGADNSARYPVFASAEFAGTGVLRVGNVSTAGICPLAARSLNEPDGTVDLTRNFIASLTEAG